MEKNICEKIYNLKMNIGYGEKDLIIIIKILKAKLKNSQYVKKLDWNLVQYIVEKFNKCILKNREGQIIAYATTQSSEIRIKTMEIISRESVAEKIIGIMTNEKNT